MTTWISVCRVNEIPVLGARRVARTQGMDVALFRTEADEVYAVLDRCPHKGGPLSQGIVFGRSVGCPLHNWTLDLATGQAAVPDEGQVPVFRVRLHGDAVQLDADEMATHAIDLPPPVAGPCIRLMPA